MNGDCGDGGVGGICNVAVRCSSAPDSLIAGPVALSGEEWLADPGSDPGNRSRIVASVVKTEGWWCGETAEYDGDTQLNCSPLYFDALRCFYAAPPLHRRLTWRSVTLATSATTRCASTVAHRTPGGGDERECYGSPRILLAAVGSVSTRDQLPSPPQVTVDKNMECAFDIAELGKTHAERVERFGELLKICQSPDAPLLLPSDTASSEHLFRWQSPTARLESLTDPFARVADVQDGDFLQPIGAFFSITTVLVELMDAATAALVDTFLKKAKVSLASSPRECGTLGDIGCYQGWLCARVRGVPQRT